MRVSDLTSLTVLVFCSMSNAFVVVNGPRASSTRRTSIPDVLWPAGKKNDYVSVVARTVRSRRQHPPPLQLLTSRHLVEEEKAEISVVDRPGFWDAIVRTFSQSANTRRASPALVRSEADRRRVQFATLLRVCVPSFLSGVAAYLVFPAAALTLAGSMHDPGVFSVLSQDSSQFVQNFLTVAGLLFSILVGQTCESMAIGCRGAA